MNFFVAKRITARWNVTVLRRVSLKLPQVPCSELRSWKALPSLAWLLSDVCQALSEVFADAGLLLLARVSAPTAPAPARTAAAMPITAPRRPLRLRR